MKIRTGFVSNSSSSSFIVAFPRRPTSVEEVFGWMFPSEQTDHSVVGYREEFTSESVARRVFEDIKNEDPCTLAEIAEEISSGWFDGQPAFPAWDHTIGAEQQQEQYLRHEAETNAAALKMAERFVKGLPPGAFIFIVGYSDNEGAFESHMEHGEIFSEVPHIQVSHH